MRPVHVAGGALTDFGRLGRSLASLAVEAAEGALADAGLARGDVDHLLLATQAPEELADVANSATHLATELGLAPVPATRVETGPSSGGSALEAATWAVGSGAVDTVLVVGAETLAGAPTAEVSRVLARMMDEGERGFGLTMPALAALTTRRYLRDHGVTREVLALAPVKAHRLAARNPRAHLRREVSVEDVLASPVVADPLRLYDCAPLSDGAAAVVVTSEPGPVRVRGVGHATDLYSLGDRPGADALTSFPATRHAARRAFDAAGLAPADVDVVEMHDAFSILELMNPADLGLLSHDEALAALVDGRTGPDGDLPLNVTGGLKARGHPVGATGVAQVAELLRQLTGSAGALQAENDPRIGLAHNIGGYGNNVVVTLLEAMP